jgi:hypothetical protein
VVVRRVGVGVEEDAVLLVVACVVLAQEAAAGARRGVGDRVELVVAHHGERRAAVDHRAHDADHGALLRTAVDEVPEEDRAPGRVTPHAVLRRVAEHLQEGLQRAGVAVDVPDDVVTHLPHRLAASLCCGAF